MTETMTPPTSASQSEPQSPRLERPAGSVFRGVCTAVARTTGTDVMLWRLLLVVLCFFNGLGFVLYGIGLVAIPRQGASESLAQRLLRGPNRRLGRDELLLLALFAVAIAGLLSNGSGWVALAVIVAVALMLRHRTHAPEASTPVAPAVRQNVDEPGLADPLTTREDAVVVPPPPSAPRQRSPLTGLTLSTALLVAGVLVLLAAGGVSGITAPVVVASMLAVVGLGLVVGAWWGRPRGLTFVAVLLALALGGTAAAQPVLDAGVGERDWVATGDSTYRLGMGDAVLRLSDNLAPGSEITAKLDVGHLEVVVPEGLRVVIDAHVQMGEIRGLDQDRSSRNGRDVSQTLVYGPPGGIPVHIDAEVYAGQVEVSHG